jgi:hypothetical protein
MGDRQRYLSYFPRDQTPVGSRNSYQNSVLSILSPWCIPILLITP